MVPDHLRPRGLNQGRDFTKWIFRGHSNVPADGHGPKWSARSRPSSCLAVVQWRANRVSSLEFRASHRLPSSKDFTLRPRWPTILMIFASAIVVLRLPEALSKRAQRAELAQGLVEVAQTLESEFVRELTRNELQEGAIQGMVERTGDPYTIWIPPRDRNEFVKEVQGTFAGIGVLLFRLIPRCTGPNPTRRQSCP